MSMAHGAQHECERQLAGGAYQTTTSTTTTTAPSIQTKGTTRTMVAKDYAACSLGTLLCCKLHIEKAGVSDEEAQEVKETCSARSGELMRWMRVNKDSMPNKVCVQYKRLAASFTDEQLLKQFNQSHASYASCDAYPLARLQAILDEVASRGSATTLNSRCNANAKRCRQEEGYTTSANAKRTFIIGWSKIPLGRGASIDVPQYADDAA